MIITDEQLAKKWDSHNFSVGGYVLIDEKHPLDLYIGYESIDQKAILLISEKEPETLPSSKSINVTKRFRSDKKWTLLFTLVQNEQEKVFISLCADIITFSGVAKDESSALLLLTKRYKQWNKLLDKKKNVLDENSRKGLLGELIYLSSVIKSGVPVLSAIQGWVGPNGADQDFVYATGWYEIKTVNAATAAISVSSLEQLSDYDPGEIVVMRIDKCAPEHTGAISLGDQVDKVLSQVAMDSEALSLFEEKLEILGYIDTYENREHKYFFSGSTRYVVNRDFPRLTRSTTPPQIISAQYVLSLAAIENWKLED